MNEVLAESTASQLDIQQPTLLEQADGLSRERVMKLVMGPALSEFLCPVYNPELTKKEHLAIADRREVPFGQSPGEVGALKISRKRLENLLHTGSNILYELDVLNDERPELLHHDDLATGLRENVRSGVVVPLMAATYVYKAENDPAFIPRTEETIEILERENIDDVLLHLTKGPNGFLGSASLNIQPASPGFFEFRHPYAGKLAPEDAFTMKGGKVVGLSSTYHIAAQNKRQSIHERYKTTAASLTHDVSHTSGCPVRHSFEDEAGQRQEPLIITAKNFVLSALRVSC
jgi:hypothetical protein